MPDGVLVVLLGIYIEMCKANVLTELGNIESIISERSA